jgi:hypothetical protein
VSTSLKYKFEKDVAKLCSIYRNRIGSWINADDLDALIKRTVGGKLKDFSLPANVLINVSKKGVSPLKFTFEVVFPGLKADQVEIYNQLLDTAKKVLVIEEYSELALKFPPKQVAASEVKESLPSPK